MVWPLALMPPECAAGVGAGIIMTPDCRRDEGRPNLQFDIHGGNGNEV